MSFPLFMRARMEKHAAFGKTTERASAMSHREMATMVRLLDKYKYEDWRTIAKKPPFYKKTIMQKIARILKKQYGVDRDIRQLQKRWSDLKCREKNQLKKIRETIRKKSKQTNHDRTKTNKHPSSDKPCQNSSSQTKPVATKGQPASADIEVSLNSSIQTMQDPSSGTPTSSNIEDHHNYSSQTKHATSKTAEPTSDIGNFQNFSEELMETCNKLERDDAASQCSIDLFSYPSEEIVELKQDVKFIKLLLLRIAKHLFNTEEISDNECVQVSNST
ncbi:uncharacterized protein LOC121397033 [Xenopus laevis]|uniref:Uncharacterized protein LOC121394219 n=1 Tax=Xenopus laevis TaxID=8355 RepID=A0A8J1LI05_XENLA|nr:uncharacterized protein LOC121394219 [Xenopus laevis]XP_041420507.1 uncharacterized protein LOC121394220 [Xenopus laevis]XP_041423095.1 uncharacterized protein LOC121394980 [Xenopus laevis]XP_041427057.1 uncharacterized protein LOC121396284 [Xenopus laevis]XP_041427077.1 uncharacterized protein LOC121396293 [Xenopus laevis]XP_041428699.1 uncharacterized protein LOC121397033 [Xenopus laevis]